VRAASLCNKLFNYIGVYVMLIKHITKNLFDVFWKTGWDNCVRIKRNGEAFRVIKAYKKPPQDVFKFIKESIK